MKVKLKINDYCRRIEMAGWLAEEGFIVSVEQETYLANTVCYLIIHNAEVTDDKGETIGLLSEEL